MAGPFLAGSEMRFWPRSVQCSPRLHQVLPRGLRWGPFAAGPAGQGPGDFLGVVRARRWERQGGTAEEVELKKLLGGSRLLWVSARATMVTQRLHKSRQSGPGVVTPHLGAHLGYRAGWGVVSADSSRGGHSAEGLSRASGPLLCPVPRRALSAPE